ncbi:fibronectin type III domain-containing protein [Microvirga sp. STR05]|uniref:Fibronectin type III domain-containing protein n=1 Tax=Hymenobacter duratus TaxID=2771356 RepID=A0ABR8JEZ7_9BACT|nr:fibronectin type III domain-containing protein [Hymenobacter duratus]MBD2713965.1 fibronectin type III domain-containing protein [Hymenobacter duratus]MBR7948867.1 fibronectin type III domain-containing protein [Microvirga sp. STR05]
MSTAQAQVDTYQFAASQGTFTPLPATATVVAAVQDDDAISGAVPIGFSFAFDGVPYTNVYASSNGFLSFNSAASSSLTNDLDAAAAAIRPLVAPLWDDLAGEGAGSAAKYQTTGTAPNRVFTFEWLSWEWNYSATAPVVSFQVKLYETTNRVEFVYRPENGTPNSASASIGISGTSTPVDFLSLNNTSASPTASSTVETTSIATVPASGQVYAFTPPPATGCPTPRNLTVTSTTANSAVVSWTVTGGSGTFSINYGPTGFTPGTGGQTITSATNSVTIPGLTASTEYQFYVTQICSGSTSGRSNAGSFRTDCVTPLYASVPFNETFESTWLSRCNTRDVPGNNWRNTPLTGNNSWRREDDGAAANWTAATSYLYSPTGAQGSAHSARFHSGYSSAGLIGTMDLYVNMTGAGNRELSFDYINTTGSDSLTVQISTDGGLTFGPQLLRFGLATAWQPKTLALNTTSATTVIRFRARADFGSTDIGLDNVSISACARVSNLAVSNITGTSATVTFTPITGVSNYTVVATPATGPAVTVTGTGSPVNLTGLQGLTQYTVSVVSSCAVGQTSVPVTASFTTLIPPTVNDEPCNATALTPGSAPLASSNLGATATVANGYSNPGCSTAANPKDVWFRFVAPASSTTLSVQVAGNPAGQVRLFSAASCNGPFTQIACQGSTGSNIAAGQLPLPALTAGTTYYISVSGFGSSDTQGPFTIGIANILSTGVGQLPQGEVSVYPNPSHDGTLTLSLRGINTTSSVKAEMLNALGQRVMTQQVPVRGGSVDQALPVQGLAKGFYTLRLQVGESTITRKVVLD